MRFKAIETENKPYISWISTNEPLGSLVIDEAELPRRVFGVYPYRIVEGELVDWSPEEMTIFEEEWNLKQIISNQKAKLSGLNEGTFEFDSHEFPTNEVARWHYLFIERNKARSHNVVSLTGNYNLAPEDIDAFLAAFWNCIESLTIDIKPV